MKLEFFTVDDEHKKFIFPRNSYKKLLSGDAEVVSALEHAKKYKAYEVVEQDYKKPNRAFANLNKDAITEWITAENPDWAKKWKTVIDMKDVSFGLKKAYFLDENPKAKKHFKIKETNSDAVKLKALKNKVEVALIPGKKDEK